MSDHPTDLKLELKNVVVAVREVTEWYDLGLQFGLPDHILKLISSHPDIASHKRMMLSEWLQYDTKASWEKLATALEAIGKRAIADKIRRSFWGVMISDQNLESKDKKTRLAMVETVLSKIKSRFSLLAIDVRSAMEVRQVDVHDIRQFLLTYFEGECCIPDVPNLRKVFENVSAAKLWRYDHYGPLEELAEAFLPDDDTAVVHVTEYISQLSGFYATTRIIDLVDLSELDDPEDDNQPFSPKKYNRHYRKLTLELKLDRNVKFSEVTLEYVHKLWTALRKKFNLPSLTAVIDKIVEGSIKVTYLVLPHIAKRIKDSCHTALDFFQLHGITKICLHDDLVTLYDEKWMEGSTPLYQASFSGNTDEVMSLLKEGANSNQQNDSSLSDTPLWGACRGGSIDTAKLLLDHGANVDSQNKRGESVLMLASAYGQTEIVKLLLKYKAQVNMQAHDKATALIYASTYGNPDIVGILLDHGAIVDHCEKKDEYSALMCASVAGNAQTAIVLLQHGARVDLTNDDYGRTALIYASVKGQAGSARVLLEYGATVDLSDCFGITPLWYASRHGRVDTIKELVEFGAKVDLPIEVDNSGTALAVASQNGHTQATVVLIEHGAVIDYQDKKGLTPLHRACVGGHAETVKVLLENKAQVNIQTEDGWSAIFFAMKQGDTSIVKLLLDYGATLGIKSKSGLTVFDIAKAKSCRATYKVLKQYVHIQTQDYAQHQPQGTLQQSQHKTEEGYSNEQEPKIDLTEDQEAEVQSVGELIRNQLQRMFLREVTKKREQTSGDLRHNVIMNQPKEKRSLLNHFWHTIGQARHPTRRVVNTTFHN